MATPVPVVSMMYFFESTPPKTFLIVRPALAASSVNKAMGFAGAGLGGPSDHKRIPEGNANTIRKRARIRAQLLRFQFPGCENLFRLRSSLCRPIGTER